MPEKLKEEFINLNKKVRESQAEIESSVDSYLNSLENDGENQYKLQQLTTALRYIHYFEPRFIENKQVVEFWELIHNLSSYLESRDKPWFNHEDRKLYKQRIEENNFFLDIKKQDTIAEVVNQKINEISGWLDDYTKERFSQLEMKQNDFDTYSNEGKLLNSAEIQSMFQSGVILSHSLNRSAKNFTDAFRQIIYDGLLESEASLTGSNKIRIDADEGPSQVGPYILPDISFWMNRIYSDVNFLIPMENITKSHLFYGRDLEFHIYPKAEEMADIYNEYRKTGEIEKLKKFENKCALNNSILLILRGYHNNVDINILTNILLNKKTKIKGFCIVDFNEESKAQFEKNKTDEYFQISDILRQWGERHNIKLFDGDLEKHPMLYQKIKRTPFRFTQIHGADAYDRTNNEIFFTND